MKSLFFIPFIFGLFSCSENKKIEISKDVMFGIDVSSFQGNINWSKVKKSKHPIEFVIVRATMGTTGRIINFPKI
jgi:GH25 family lysozyme M1 (1,4-beta-N-acetylmuramidase)